MKACLLPGKFYQVIFIEFDLCTEEIGASPGRIDKPEP